MPIYEYQCGNCYHQLEIMQKMNEEAISICPACNQPTLSKKVSAAGFQLKGTGWYVTDFKQTQKSDKQVEPVSSGAEEKSVSAEKPSTEPKTQEA